MAGRFAADAGAAGPDLQCSLVDPEARLAPRAVVRHWPKAIVYNDDNRTYGAIISVYTGPDDTVTALTDDGIDELKDMLRDARITTETWHAFLDDLVDDTELVARIKAQSLR